MGIFFPLLDREQIEEILKNAGFAPKRHDGSSHAHWEGHVKDRRRVVTVDHLGGKKKEKYGRRLIQKMIEQSGLTKKEFYSFLGK